VTCNTRENIDLASSRSHLENAALVAEVLGAIAVVVSVIYLAVQITDNTRMLRSQSHYNALEVLQRPFELMLESDSLAPTLNVCDRQPYEVEASKWSRCVTYYFMQANGWEYTYYQNIEDAIPPELWVGVDGYMGDLAKTRAGWVRFWSETSHAFGEPFRSYIDERVRQNPAYKQLQE
jgi:hypothetical protein